MADHSDGGVSMNSTPCTTPHMLQALDASVIANETPPGELCEACHKGTRP